MGTAAFKSYKNGYYNFWCENGDELSFDGVIIVFYNNTT
jgi:hypothetical protein